MIKNLLKNKTIFTMRSARCLVTCISRPSRQRQNNIDLPCEPANEHIKILQNINFSRRPSIQRQNVRCLWRHYQSCLKTGCLPWQVFLELGEYQLAPTCLQKVNSTLGLYHSQKAQTLPSRLCTPQQICKTLSATEVLSAVEKNTVAVN